jgi:hypothetical protein
MRNIATAHGHDVFLSAHGHDVFLSLLIITLNTAARTERSKVSAISDACEL